MSLPVLRASVNLTATKTCLTLTHKDNVGEFFLDPDGTVDIWQIDDWISKLLAEESEKQNIRNKLLGKS